MDFIVFGPQAPIGGGTQIRQYRLVARPRLSAVGEGSVIQSELIFIKAPPDPWVPNWWWGQPKRCPGLDT
jgi:hypothetical protein